MAVKQFDAIIGQTLDVNQMSKSDNEIISEYRYSQKYNNYFCVWNKQRNNFPNPEF